MVCVAPLSAREIAVEMVRSGQVKHILNVKSVGYLDRLGVV